MKLWFQRDGQTSPVTIDNVPAQVTYSSENRSFTGQHAIKLVIFLFCILEIIDALITYWAVRSQLVMEGNHFISQNAGNLSFILLKFTGAVVSGLVLSVLNKHIPKLSMATAVSIAVFYLAVLAWNSSMIISILTTR